MSDGLLAIGAFSRASHLSVKMLRAYHEAGILVPERVDPRTGYRAYGPGQLADAAVIRRLRDLDLPLDRVHEVVAARDPAVTRRVLAEHAAVMRERLESVTRIVADLQAGVEDPLAHTPVLLRDEPAAHTLALRREVAPDGLADFFGSAFARLEAVAARAGLTVSGPPGALYVMAIPDGPEPVEAFLPVAAPRPLPDSDARDGVVLGELPSVRVAVVVHHGAYDTIEATYRRVGAWVADHATPTGERVRERYVVGYGDTEDPAALRTEIQWPVGGHATPHERTHP